MFGALPSQVVFGLAVSRLVREDDFEFPPVPDWVLERKRVTDYKNHVVRHMRAYARLHSRTLGQVAKALGASPRRTAMILKGEVFMDEPEDLYALLLKLDPETPAPRPESIPAATPDEIREIEADVSAKIQVALGEEGEGIPAERVFAEMRERSRKAWPLGHLKREGKLRVGGRSVSYGTDPETGTVHGEARVRRELLMFEASDLGGLPAAFERKLAEQDAFCAEAAVPPASAASQRS